ncbi:MAG: hypothetical protein MJ105_08980 [Lachnospiraceae bacterium]|nr:hypothetical protein [Lachnospiraceae bacterium]
MIKDQELLTAILERAKWHDVDKLVMYMALDQRLSQEHHVQMQPHHLECMQEKSEIDLLETVIDYECSPYTKPDKPLNAYDFLNKLISMNLVETTTANRLLEIMHTLGIDRSYSVTEDQDGMAYANSLTDITEEMILQETEGYTDPALEEWISAQLKKHH